MMSAFLIGAFMQIFVGEVGVSVLPQETLLCDSGG